MKNSALEVCGETETILRVNNEFAEPDWSLSVASTVTKCSPLGKTIEINMGNVHLGNQLV